MFFNCFPYTDFHELNADWIIRHFKELLDSLKQIDSWMSEHEKEYEELKKLYDQLYDGTLSPALIKSLELWINKNLETLIGKAIKNAFFGLTADGYLIAYIPDSWNEIQFNTTGYDTSDLGVGYGHLVLSY